MKVAIIGAGLSGLAAAHTLRRAGHEAVIYEASDRAGGRGMLLNRPGTDDWADVGSQYYHSNYKLGLKLIDEVGLTPKLKKIGGYSRMYTGEGADSYKLNPSMPWMKTGGILGNLKVAGYLARLLLFHRSETFAATPDQAVYDNRAALQSTNDVFVRDHTVRMLSLIGGMSEPDAANINLLQIHRLAKIIMLTDYVSLEGGTARLHNVLAEQSDIRFGSAVRTLVETGGGVSGLELQNGDRVEADHVIVAADAPGAAQIVPAGWTEERTFLDSVMMRPGYIISFFLDHALEDGVWTYFFPFDREGPVSFCVDAHQKSPGNHPSGKATLQAWILNPKAAALSDKTDEELAAIALADISPMVKGVEGHVEAHAVTRHKGSVPQSRVGHNAAAIAFLDAIDQRPGVTFCGDYFSGGYMESALWSVERAMPRIMSEAAQSNVRVLDANDKRAA
ncbi:MAG: FAD-dependent oxidoreductase [Pseudomonadota bacterium]